MSGVALDIDETESATLPHVSIDISRHANAAGLLQLSTISIGIVCPMASEADTAVRFVDAVLKQCRGRDFKSITLFAVLDRACKDNTRELLAEHTKQNPELQVVWAPENKGVVDDIPHVLFRYIQLNGLHLFASVI